MKPSSKIKKSFLSWMNFIDQVQVFMTQEGFQNIRTPYLVSSGAMESHLDCFQTQWHWGSHQKFFELPTSPEFHLKKALAMGFKDVFEIKTCFRNEEYSHFHRPEFYMLEFYKCNISWSDFICWFQNWWELLLKALKLKSPKPQFLVTTVQELFHQIGCSLEPHTEYKEFKSWADQLNIDYDEKDTQEDIFFRIFIERIEPFLDSKKLTIMKGYPGFQRALSCLDSQGWAQRFELYGSGLEICNAYCELNNKDEFESLCKIENQKRQREGKPPHSMDFDFLKIHGQMPKACGIAIGLERLFMILYGYQNINDFQIFS